MHNNAFEYQMLHTRTFLLKQKTIIYTQLTWIVGDVDAVVSLRLRNSRLCSLSQYATRKWERKEKKKERTCSVLRLMTREGAGIQRRVAGIRALNSTCKKSRFPSRGARAIRPLKSKAWNGVLPVAVGHSLTIDLAYTNPKSRSMFSARFITLSIPLSRLSLLARVTYEESYQERKYTWSHLPFYEGEIFFFFNAEFSGLYSLYERCDLKIDFVPSSQSTRIYTWRNCTEPYRK